MSTKDKLPVIKILIYPFDGILHLIEPLQTRLYSLDIHTTITNTNVHLILQLKLLLEQILTVCRTADRPRFKQLLLLYSDSKIKPLL